MTDDRVESMKKDEIIQYENNPEVKTTNVSNENIVSEEKILNIKLESKKNESTTEETEPESSKEAETNDHSFAVPDLPFLNVNKAKQETANSNVQDENKALNDDNDKKTTPDKKIKPDKVDKKSIKKSVEFPHQQPAWGGVPLSENDNYSLTVLKEGIVRSTFNLSGKAKVTFGRLPEACDVLIEHPSCSRFHAVLQYCVEEKDIRKVGYYIYDLGSTHGTYVNKERVKPKVYVRVRVGYQIKFGGSSRLYIMEGPNEDQEEELDMSEVKKIKEHNKQVRATKQKQKQTSMPAKDGDGASWGFQEDAEEEELDLKTLLEKKKKIDVKDPKKTLKGFFDREGIDFEYEMSERGFGTKVVHVAQVRLPIESSYGVEMIAEGTSSNKKDAVLNCATDACRIIQAYDMMQNKCSEDQRLKRQRELEENDFYDSDEDNFLDRTGSIEKKRLKRKQMAGKAVKQEAETHDSLKAKLKEKRTNLKTLETKLKKSTETSQDEEDGDSLDAFMSNMGNKLDKKDESQLKQQIKELNSEILELERLVELTQPALPALKIEQQKAMSGIKEVSGNKLKKVEKVENISGKEKGNKNIVPNINTIDTNKHLTTENVVPEKVNEPSSPPIKKKKVYGVSLPPPQNNGKKKDSNEKEFIEWMPPKNQSGDGRTHLNDKLGY